MTSIEGSVRAKLRKENEVFEILVDKDKIFDYKEGKVPLSDILTTAEIFKNIKQGEKASEHEMEKIFHTNNKEEIAKIIIDKGEIQLTAEHKKKIIEEKRKRIIDIIHKNGINPQTNLPHPPERIERALEEAKARIDEFKKPEEQVEEIIKQIQPIMPISIEKRILEIKIPAQHAAKAYSILKSIGNLKKDEWKNDGSLRAKLEIPAGLQEELENELNKIAHGDIEINQIGSE